MNLALDILVSHQDQVLELADDMQVLAGSEFCENAVCQVGDHIPGSRATRSLYLATPTRSWCCAAIYSVKRSTPRV